MRLYRRCTSVSTVLQIVVIISVIICSILHLQCQKWIADLHDETPSFMMDLMGTVRLTQHHKLSSPEISSIMDNVTIQQISYDIQSTKKHKKKNSFLPNVASEFQRQNGVVIVTKIHGPHQWGLLEQSLCLFHYAYNHQMLYDIVVFTAESIPTTLTESMRQLISPVNITFVVDNRGLQQEIHSLSPKRQRIFLDQCKQQNNMTSYTDNAMIQNLTWFSDCGDGRLAYNWQAEFRSIHIWNHPSLIQYRHMLWIDTDAFCTKKWDRDPIAFAIEHKLVIFFDNYPGGSTRQFTTQIAKGFNKTLCKLRVTPKGELESTLGIVQDAVSNEYCNDTQIRSIHGFLHITDMDFYRNPQVIHGLQTLLGDSFLARDPDDQLAVTVPAAVLAPHRSWDMRRKGIQLDVYHNLRLDGKRSEKTMGFKQLWKTKRLRQQMQEARDVCPVTEKM